MGGHDWGLLWKTFYMWMWKENIPVNCLCREPEQCDDGWWSMFFQRCHAKFMSAFYASYVYVTVVEAPDCLHKK
jgi:hypothetical protein